MARKSLAWPWRKANKKAPLPGTGIGAFVTLYVSNLKTSLWEEEIKKPRKERYSKDHLARAVLRNLLRNRLRRPRANRGFGIGDLLRALETIPKDRKVSNYGANRW